MPGTVSASGSRAGNKSGFGSCEEPDHDQILGARKASAREDQSVMGVGDRQGGGRRVSEG